MSKKTRETRFKLPASTASPRDIHPRFGRKLREESFLQHPNNSPETPPNRNQSSEDAASSEVGPRGKGQRPPRGLSAKRATAKRRPFLQHLSHRPEAQSGPDQGSEDPASSDEGLTGKGQRSPQRLSPTSATVTRRPFPRHLSQRQAAQKGQDQSSEDAASLEVEPAGKGKRPSRRLGTKVTGASRLVVRNAEAGPDSCNWASEAPPKREKLHLGAMATPSLGFHEVGADQRGDKRGKGESQAFILARGVNTPPSLLGRDSALGRSRHAPHGRRYERG